MDDFGVLARDFGYRPQGKSTPMGSSKPPSAAGTRNSGIGGARSSNRDPDDELLFNDVFGGPPTYTSSASDTRGGRGRGGRGGSGRGGDKFDSLLQDSNLKSSSLPVYDKPVYDDDGDDIFDGLPGVKSPNASSVKYEDVFASISSSPQKNRGRNSAAFDNLLGNLGRKETTPKSSREKDAAVFDDLLPGFGGSGTPSSKRNTSESSRSQKPSSNLNTSSMMKDPFEGLESTSIPVASTTGLFTDPLEEINNLSSSGKSRRNSSSINKGVFDDIDPLGSLGKSVPRVSSETEHRPKDSSPLRDGPISAQSPNGQEPVYKYPVETADSRSHKKVPIDNFQESHQTNRPNASTDFRRSVGQTTSSPSYVNVSHIERTSQVDVSPSAENLETHDEVWLTVSEIPLFTQPTSAPPPSRPPPPRPARVSKSHSGSFGSINAKKKVNDIYSFPNSVENSHSPMSARAAAWSPKGSQIDELEDFTMGKTQNNVNKHANVKFGEDLDTNSVAAAAAMKDAMDRAEAKFRHAKEVRVREDIKAARYKESVPDEDERSMQDFQDRESREKQDIFDRERQKREKEEEEREQRRVERERERAREIEREREEKERERRRLERERERAKQAVERATREARERAAAEARLKAEKAAVEKANGEARERAERAAVQRAQAEARERAAVEARERAEKAAAEARERELRERLSRANQQKNDNDLESFFSTNSRPSSTPRSSANTSDPMFDTQARSKVRPEAGRRTSVGASSNMRKTSSVTNIVDDLSSIFGAAPSAGEFQEVDGENEERRRSRLERHQRTQERAAKALAEKNQRDLQAQREQTERHRIAETLDVEIKRWAAGKEGNLRALLSTLQYVLWPECGWQPVSLTDLITAAAVKKVYRKATLCIHPDKVQQKGANLQQKYIAEKVFDLLKEAWNKLNSEELF